VKVVVVVCREGNSEETYAKVETSLWNNKIAGSAGECI
jgi:hypothetical protein